MVFIYCIIHVMEIYFSKYAFRSRTEQKKTPEIIITRLAFYPFKFFAWISRIGKPLLHNEK